LADVTATFRERWQTGQHIGEARPGLRAEVATGRFNRRYDVWPGDAIDATIGSSDPDLPWQAFWTPDGPPVALPNVLSCNKTKGLDANGIETATIVIENIAYPAIEGGGHLIRRGYLAPLRGYVAPGMTALHDEAGDVVAENEWFGKLSKHSQITVYEALGDEEVRAFTGLIDDVDVTSRPGRITVTARDFGQVLADERLFGWNKDPACKDPITFIDRDQADDIVSVGDTETASSEDADHPATNIGDSDSATSWISQSHSDPAVTEWAEVRLPQGKYDDYWLWAAYAGMEIYVSVYATSWIDETGTHAPQRDGVDIPTDAWVDTGAGIVPGAEGGIPYVLHVSGVSGARVLRDLDALYTTGDDSKLRISFRTLGDNGGGDYRAGAIELQARARNITPAAVRGHWILVDDVADVVKVILRWAGFKEWEVESTGVRLQKRIVVGRDKFYVDIINLCRDAVGYTFFMGDPTADPESIGVPVFRKTRAVVPSAEPTITVTDQDLLLPIQVRQSNAPLAYIIRVRGRVSSNGQTLGSAKERRIMFTYRPPWSGTPMAGVIKHVVLTNHLFKSADDLKFAAYYIALQEAIEANKATIEIPAFPGVDIDDHVELRDLSTGITSRLAITQRDSEHQSGEQTKWTMTLSGALIDVPEVRDMVAVIEAAVRA
jgi:hypothetical protein